MSRPKLKDGAKRQNVTLTLPPKLIRDAKEMAYMGGVSLSQMIQILIELQFENLDQRIADKKRARKNH
jgi:hypothetical protein